MSLPISSCASVTVSKNLYGSYRKITESVVHRDYEKAVTYMSSSIKAKAIAGQEFPENFSFIYSLSTAISEEQAHFESVDKGRVCLTVNGFDSSSEPLSVNLEFVSEGAQYKLSYIEINYLSSINELPVEGFCPAKPG